jgi:hypothetical protein
MVAANSSRKTDADEPSVCPIVVIQGQGVRI